MVTVCWPLAGSTDRTSAVEAAHTRIIESITTLRRKTAFPLFQLRAVIGFFRMCWTVNGMPAGSAMSATPDGLQVDAIVASL